MVKSSGCAGISFEKWEALKGKTGRGWPPSAARRRKDDPRLAAGLSVTPWSRMAGDIPGTFFHRRVPVCRSTGISERRV